MEEEDELFEVEFFLNTRVKDGKRYFKVRWKGFPPEEDTWEPEENVLECKEALEAFWKKKRKNANKRQKMRRDRLVSEEGDQEPPSTSRENKPSKPFDIEPLGLTRQASKELAICLNKSRNSTKQNFESSSQTESDVTLVENDVSSKSTLASSQTGSDITSSDNDFSSQGSGLKSSGTGSDALDQSSNENNTTKDVIDVSSQDSLLNQSDFEFSPRETSSRNQAFENENARKIEVISLLSDSEDTEGESSETGNQLSGIQSPDVVQSSRDSTHVVRRESFKTPENTPSNSSQTNEPQDTKKATDQLPDVSQEQLQSPSNAKESEGDPFGTSVRRKNRFELSLRKNRKRKLSTIESSSSESPKTEEEEEEALNVDVKKRDIISDENVFITTRGKTKLQILKENMLGLEKTERTAEQCGRVPEPTEPRAKRALARGRGATSNSFDDECPTIIELKGIMHEIAKNKYQHHVEGNIRGTSEVAVGVKDEGSLGESSASTPVVLENVKIMPSGGDENAVPGDLDLREERDERYLNIPDISEDRLVEDEDCCTFDEQKTSKEYNQTTRRKDEGKMNAMISKSLGEEIENENLKGVEEDEPNRKEGESGFDKGVDSERISNEGDNNSSGEAIAEKHDEKEMDTERRKPGLAHSSGKKAVVLSSESTNRVLKNLRFLAAKRRKPKNIETTTSSTTFEKKSDDLIDSNVQIDVNSQNRNADNRDIKLAVEEEELKVGNEKELKEKENKSEREIEGKNGDKEGNESKKPEQVGIENRTNDESGLIDSKKTKTPVYEDDNNIKSNAADTNENEMNSSQDQREKLTNVGRSTDDKGKPAEERTIEQVAFTSEISRDRSSEKNDIPSTKRKADDLTTVENKNSDSEISADVSTSKTPNFSPVVKSFSIHGGIRSQGCQGDTSINETLALDFQKHSTGESSAVDEKHRPEIKKSRKMLKKSHDKAASAKPSIKRMKLQQAKTKCLNSKKQDVEILDGGKTLSSSSSVKSKSQTSKTLKRTNKAQMNKIEEIDATVKISKPLPNAQEQKRILISDANFSSSLTSGDLIGAIIDGDQKPTLKHEQRKSIAKENSDSKALVAERQEEDVMIEDDEDFDFELEDFPLEKLLQEEDEIDLRSIPSPPVEPMDVPFASVKTAIRDGDEMTVRAALAGGLELDTLDGASGMTLLMLAAASGQDGVVELLLRRKADVNACQKNGMTALMHACEQGYPETAHVLLLCGADINKQQIAGETALMKACKKGHTDVVEVLLKNGADTRLESKSGHMAQQFAIRGYPELSSLMEEHEKRLGRVVEEAILKCLGDTVSLCKPAILYYRCVVPREGQQMTFPFHYTPKIYNKEVDVILFCIKAVFDDVVSLLFGEDNGVRGILLNNKSQIPLLHGVRSIFSIDPKSRQNTITLQTHKCSNPASRIILCIYAVQSKS